VLAVHRAYFNAGAQVLLTNTFCADGGDALCQAAVALARKAVGQHRYVLGDIGPGEDAVSIAHALDGVDGIVMETLSDPLAIKPLAQTLPGSQRPLLASFTFRRTASAKLETVTGLAPEAVAQQAAECGVHALGVNCGRDISMDNIIEIVQRYRTATALPLFARPNAGKPTKVSGQWVYPCTSEQMAAKLPELLKAGVVMVGGCCGTTPEHIAAFAQVIQAWNRCSL
jgi:methionine synthase I (cobalamin-dependent)